MVKRSLGHEIEELPEDKTNPAVYLTYLEEDFLLEWMENDKYN